MTSPKIADKTPKAVALEEGKTYYFCTCGYSENQPFCDGAHKTAGTDLKSLAFTAEKTETKFLCMCKCTGKAPFCDGAHSKL